MDLRGRPHPLLRSIIRKRRKNGGKEIKSRKKGRKEANEERMPTKEGRREIKEGRKK